MAKNYDALAKQVLELVGGRENVASAMHCYTRLRINCKDTSIVDLDAIKQLDVLGAQFTGEQLQVIIGNEVKEVYEAFIEQSGLQKEAMIDEKLDDVPAKKKWTIKGMLTGIVDAIVACVIPLIPILIGSGVLQAIVLIIQQFGWLPADSPTLVTINFVANAAFYFLPVFVGFFAAKKFGANVALGAMLGAALIHPTFVSMVTAGDAGSVFGLPIYSASYSSTIVPIILAVWVMSYVEKFISRYSPKAIRTILEPSLTLIIMIPLTFCLLAPLGAMLSDGFASLLTWFYGIFGPLAVAAFAAIVPWVVMVGIHIGTTAISVTTIAQTGIDAFMMPGFFISNFAQGAACLAVGIKAQTTELRSFAYSCAFSNVVPGISEPGMYGITLRYKTPMAGAMIGAAAGGLYFGLTGTGALQFLPPNIFAFVGYMGEGAFAGNLMNAIIGVVIAMVVAFIATMFLYKPEKENA